MAKELSIRRLKPADKIKVGSKKSVVDYLASKGVPNHHKEYTLVVVNPEDEVVWIVGRLLSTNFRLIV